MRNSFNNNNGLTLVEVIVSMGIVLLMSVAATQTLLNSQFLTSYSRHKMQAMYTAQWLLEQKRKQPFVAVNSVTNPPATVILDYSNNFTGTAVTTVTNLDANRNQVKVEIDWQEQVLSAKITMKEVYETNIGNDAVLN